jgi:hypothetical protein
MARKTKNLNKNENKYFTVTVPNPEDLSGAWVNVGRFEKFEDAQNFVKEKIGIPDEHIELFITGIPK